MFKWTWRLTCLILSWNITAATSVVIIGSAKNTLISVLVGSITNETLTELRHNLLAAQVNTKEFKDFPKPDQEEGNSSCNIAMTKLTNQYTFIENQMQRLQATIDGQSKTIEMLNGYQTKMFQMLENIDSQLGVDRDLKMHRKDTDNQMEILRTLDHESKVYQHAIDSQILENQSKIINILDKVDRQAESHYRQNAYESHSRLLEMFETQSKNCKITNAVQSEIVQKIENQLKLQQLTEENQLTGETQLKILKILQQVHTQSTCKEIPINVQSEDWKIINNTQSKIVKMLENIENQYKNIQNSIDTQSIMYQMNNDIQLNKTTQIVNMQSNILETQSKNHQITIDNLFKMQKSVDDHSAIQLNKTDQFVNTQSKLFDAQSKIVQLIDDQSKTLLHIYAQSKNLQKSIGDLSATQRIKYSTHLNETTQIGNTLTNMLDYISKINQVIDNHSKTLQSFDTQSKNLQKSINDESAIQRTNHATQLNKIAQIITIAQSNSEAKSRMFQMLDTQLKALRNIDYEINNHQTNIRSKLNQIIEDQLKKYLAISEKQSKIFQMLQNITTPSKQIA